MQNKTPRTSFFVETSDRTRLAVDLLGDVTGREVPILLCPARYGRSHRRGARVETLLDREPWTTTLIERGYAIAVADLRGSGASHGMRSEPGFAIDGADMAEIACWLATRQWSTGKVGLFGASYSGLVLYHAAAAGSEHIAAIAPRMAPYDIGASFRPAGIPRTRVVEHWLARALQHDRDPTVHAVDEDDLPVALEAHLANEYDPAAAAPSPEGVAAAIRRSGVPVLHIGGWREPWPGAGLAWRAAIGDSVRVWMGPWVHGVDTPGLDLGDIHATWFDTWMRDDQPSRGSGRVHVVPTGAGDPEWTWFERWPPDSVHTRILNLARDTLLDHAPRDETHEAAPSTGWTSGVASRWAALLSGRVADWHLDETGPLTYQSDAVSTPAFLVDATLELELRATGPVDLVATLSCSSSAGILTLLTQAVERVSSPKTRRIRLALGPLAHRTQPGDRLHLRLTGSDTGNLDTSTQRGTAIQIRYGTGRSTLCIRSLSDLG